MNRRAQLRDLYGLDFPDDLFAFWDWLEALPPEPRKALSADAGVRIAVRGTSLTNEELDRLRVAAPAAEVVR